MAHPPPKMLVDVNASADAEELLSLLSFHGVDGISVEGSIEISEAPGRCPSARIGSRVIALAPLPQLRRFASEISQRPGVAASEDAVLQALILSFVGGRSATGIVVTSAGNAFSAEDAGLLGTAALVDLDEAFAILGAHVRQNSEVRLCGDPPLVEQQTEVYPWTARVILPHGQRWWSAAVSSFGSNESTLRQAQAVFTRVGQGLRGRDGLHEALRVGSGRSAVVDALYHFDVVLMSLLGALDGLARVAHLAYLLTGSSFGAGWHKPWQAGGWLKKVEAAVAPLAAVVAEGSRAHAFARLLAKTRNTIHAVPPEEYLSVDERVRIEHRVMLPPDVAVELQDAAGDILGLDDFGLYLHGPGVPFVNVGQFTEMLLAGTIDLVDQLMASMLTTAAFPPAPELHLTELEEAEREACLRLAGVGRYPWKPQGTGLTADPSTLRDVAYALARARGNRR